MRFLSPTLAASLLLLGLGSPVRAQDCQGCGGLSATPAQARADVPQQQGPVLEIDDEDDKVFGEIETQLNALLIVDESGAIVVRKEFADSLPIPAERVQQMLGQFIELGADGKIHVTDRETVRPYLPMLQRFLGPESMERMRQLQTLPPEQRRDAMRRMFQNPNGPTPTPAPTPAPAPTPRPEPRPTPAPEPRATPRAERRPDPRDDDRTRQLEQRLSAVEDSLKRMERMLERSLEQRAARGADRRDGDGRADEDAPRRRGLLGGGDMMERARVWSRGLKKLREVTQPEDMEAIGRAMARLREQIKPEDLRDRGALMEKLQESIDPADMGRMMEIFSEFLGTPEGRAMTEEVEKLVARLEEMVNAQDRQGPGGRGLDRGLDGAMERLEELLGRGGENERGLREQLERLVRGRDARPEQRQEQDQRQHGQSGDERLHREGRPEAPAPRPRSNDKPRSNDRPRGLPEGARLY